MAVTSEWEIELLDRIQGEHVTVVRTVEEGQGFHSFGRFSYRGERLRIIQAGGRDRLGGRWWPFVAEDYPPHPLRCKTQRAREWWAQQGAIDGTGNENSAGTGAAGTADR
jgi:hypothetical protein